MGNIINSFASGFATAIGSLFSSPLDFLSGKSCSSICGSTWDFICYIDHFCVANILKLGLIILVFYIALFFLYLTYKIHIFHCICHTLCKASRACFAMWFYIWGHICHFLSHKLLSSSSRRHRRMNNKHAIDITDFNSSREDYGDNDDSREESSCRRSARREIDMSKRMGPCRWKENRRSHLRRSLRPRSHRVQVQVSPLGRKHPRKCRRRDQLNSNVHNVRVTHASKFTKKGKIGSVRIAVQKGK